MVTKLWQINPIFEIPIILTLQVQYKDRASFLEVSSVSGIRAVFPISGIIPLIIGHYTKRKISV